jgi:cell cycle sensor histidine kinase DivJ
MRATGKTGVSATSGGGIVRGDLTREFDFGNRGAAARRRFIRTQSVKGGVGVALCGVYAVLASGCGLAEAFAFFGLIAPIGLGVMARMGFALAPLERASILLFGALMGLLGSLTGGLESPFLAWLVILPFEAALIGRRGAVGFAAGAAIVALGTVGLLQMSGALPLSRLPEPGAHWAGASLLVAILQASLMAIAARQQNRAADAAAEASETLYRFVAEHAQDLVTRHAADGRIRYAAPASVGLLGYHPDELAQRKLSDLVHEDDRGAAETAVAQAFGGHAASAELRLMTKEGRYLWSELRFQPVSRGADAPDDVVAVTRDITERKANERALIEARDLAEDANRAKSRFLANMSHELRTPLNAIIGFSQVMMHEMFGPVGSLRYREYVRLIHESGSHLLRLINSVLDMSKIEAGRLQLSAEEFDLDEAMDQAMHFVTLQAERKSVLLRHSVAPDCHSVFADKSAVLQILINLLSNAVKFTPGGGAVSVTGGTSALGLELVVSDSGTGISAADLERLGQPFEQVKNDYTRSKEGTGLGLALVRALAALHGGDVVIDSVLGMGTTVRVTLPPLPEAQENIPRVA